VRSLCSIPIQDPSQVELLLWTREKTGWRIVAWAVEVP